MRKWQSYAVALISKMRYNFRNIFASDFTEYIKYIKKRNQNSLSNGKKNKKEKVHKKYI